MMSERLLPPALRTHTRLICHLPQRGVGPGRLWLPRTLADRLTSPFGGWLAPLVALRG